MEFLENYNFTNDEIASLKSDIPSRVLDVLVEQQKQVLSNIDYLKNLGISNYKDVFKNYYEMFLLDDTNFKAIFEKYDKADLIDKIAKNINIIEYL